MIIELAGLPGAGKTTLAQALAKETGLSVLTLSYFERVVFSVLFLILYPFASWRLWRLLVRGANGNKTLEDILIKNALLNAGAKHMRASIGGGVIDQGLVQSLLAALPENKEEILKVSKALPPADLVVFCGISEELRHQRLSLRAVRTRASVSAEEADRWERSSLATAQLVEVSLKEGGMPVVSVVVDDSLNVRALAELARRPSLVHSVIKHAALMLSFVITFPYSKPKGVSVLMYHDVARSAWKHAISPVMFDRQLRHLARTRVPVSFEEVVQWAKGEKMLPRGAVAVTFDDGYEGFVDHALPALRKYSIPATLFLTADLSEQTGPPGHVRLSLKHLELLKAEPLISIESHGMTHRYLTSLEREVVHAELVDSAARIATYTGKRPRFFAYPYGARSAEVEDLVRASYEAAATITEGFVYYGNSAARLKRIQVDATMSHLLFKLRLTQALEVNRRIVNCIRNLWHS